MEGRQGSHLLVVGGNGSHAGRSAAVHPLLPGRAEWFGAGALAEDDRSFQRTRREPATEIVSLRRPSAGRRRRRGSRTARPGAAGAVASVRRWLSRPGVVEAFGVGSLLGGALGR